VGSDCAIDVDAVVRRDMKKGAPWVFRGRLPS
jgi:hypothetical protein